MFMIITQVSFFVTWDEDHRVSPLPNKHGSSMNMAWSMYDSVLPVAPSIASRSVCTWEAWMKSTNPIPVHPRITVFFQ